MNAPSWAAPALGAVLDRVKVTAAGTGDRFPLFADPGSGRWTTTRRGSWTGGFWAGLLWLRARYTGDPMDRRVAIACTDRLAGWERADTAARGLIFWYGTMPAAGEPRIAVMRERAALACLDAYDDELGLVPWGSAFGGLRPQARADGVPGLVPLLAMVDEQAAASHLRRHLELCLGLRPFRWSWRHDREENWTACTDPPSGWSRGRAWLLLGVAEGSHLLSAIELADAAGALAPVALVPPADEAFPSGPCDTSAAAITASALFGLGHQERAVAVLEELVRSHVTDDGRLLDGCYDLGSGVAPRHELIWGNFFLAYALAALTGLVEVHAPREAFE